MTEKRSQGKILMILPPENLRDEEYAKPRRYFELQGYTVETSSSTLHPISGMISLKIVADKKNEDINPDHYLALILVGGLGASRYFEDEALKKLLKTAVEKGKVIGAISFAPTILAKAGLLTGKKATAFSSEREELINLGIHYTGRKVEVADKIITADGPLSSLDFAKAIVTLLREGKAQPVENPLLSRETLSLA